MNKRSKYSRDQKNVEISWFVGSDELKKNKNDQKISDESSYQLVSLIGEW